MSTLLESYVYNNSQGTDSVVEALTEGNNNLANVLTQLVQIHTKQGQIDASLNQNQTITLMIKQTPLQLQINRKHEYYLYQQPLISF